MPNTVSGTTRLGGLLGSPVSHSLSPAMYNDSFSYLHMDCIYLCFDVGVDDYVVKPFSSKELMMRIHAILKRTQRAAASGDQFVLKGLLIDYSARTVTIDGERIQLSPKEYELLVYLVRNAGIALTREQLLSTVWGYDFFGDDRTLDTHIKLLRRNLKDYASYIVTLRGVGYRFEKAD